ncbi:hypothetical protein Hanom_Chr00s000371g01639421 [Helianthus anomalus]
MEFSLQFHIVWVFGSVLGSRSKSVIWSKPVNFCQRSTLGSTTGSQVKHGQLRPDKVLMMRNLV